MTKVQSTFCSCNDQEQRGFKRGALRNPHASNIRPGQAEFYRTTTGQVKKGSQSATPLPATYFVGSCQTCDALRIPANYSCGGHHPPQSASFGSTNVLQNIEDAKPTAHPSPLDNIELRGDKPTNQRREKWAKRAKQKAKQGPNMAKMALLDTSRKRAYNSTFFCSQNVQITDEGHRKTMRCKRRWCTICSGVNAYHLRQKYTPIFEQFSDVIFVTLTAQTVKADELPSHIRHITRTLSKIIEAKRKRENRTGTGWRLSGLRKVEVTIRPGGLYHAHLHLLLEGNLSHGRQLLNEWVTRMRTDGKRCSLKAQNVRKADKNAFAELTSYITKDSKKDDKNELVNHPASRQDHVWEAMTGIRSIHPINITAAPQEQPTDDQETDTQETDTHAKKSEGIYAWYHGWTWVDFSSGEALTDCSPPNETG